MISQDSVLSIQKDIQFVQTFLQQLQHLNPSLQSYCYEIGNNSLQCLQSQDFTTYDKFVSCLEGNNEKKKKKKGKIKYVGKHESPQQVFNYYGINIKVIYQHYLAKGGSALVVPFSQLTKENLQRTLISEQVVEKVWRQIPSQFKNREFKPVIRLASRNLFLLRNYSSICLFPTCRLKSAKDYSQSVLRRNLQAILDQIINDQARSVVFPKFEWKALTTEEKVDIFFATIMSHLKKCVKKKYLNLRQVVICLDEYSEYMAFVKELRNISDEFVRLQVIKPSKPFFI